MKYEERNYLLLVDSNCPTFASEGWADGYNELPEDSEEIVKQLYGKVENNKLVECVTQYLNGYEYGSMMSKNIDEIYDEDGNIKDGWDDSRPIFNYTNDAISLIKKQKKKTKEINQNT